MKTAKINIRGGTHDVWWDSDGDGDYAAIALTVDGEAVDLRLRYGQLQSLREALGEVAESMGTSDGDTCRDCGDWMVAGDGPLCPACETRHPQCADCGDDIDLAGEVLCNDCLREHHLKGENE